MIQIGVFRYHLHRALHDGAVLPGHLVTDRQRREILAALALDGLDQKRFAQREGISYQRVNRMLNRVEVVTPDYARRLNGLRKRLCAFVASL